MDPNELNQFRSYILQKYPNLSKGNMEGLNQFVGGQQTQELGRQGVLDIGEIAKTEPGIALQLSTEGIKNKPDETEAKRLRAKTDAERILTELENNYFGANNNEGLAYGRLRGIGETLKARAGENADLNTYIGLRESLRPTFARAAGDVGNLSKSEQDRAVKTIPTALNTPEEAAKFFKATREKFGLPERNLTNISSNLPSQQPQQISPEGQTMGQPQQEDQGLIPQLKSRVLSGLFPGLYAARIPGLNSVLAPRGKELLENVESGQQVSPDQMLGVGGEYLSNALPFAGLGSLPVRMGLGGLIRGGTTPGAEPEERVKSGLLQGAIGTGLGFLGRGAEKLGGLRPTATGTKIREQAVKEAVGKVSGKDIIADMKSWVDLTKQAYPGKEKSIERIFNSIKTQYKGTIDPQKGLELFKAAKSGFTKAGQAKTVLDESAGKALRASLKARLEPIAPGFTKGTELVQKGLARGKTLGNLLKYGVAPTILSAGIYKGIGSLGDSDY